MGPWTRQQVPTDRNWCVEELHTWIKVTDWKQARDDVRSFVKAHELPSLDPWTRELLLPQCDKLA